MSSQIPLVLGPRSPGILPQYNHHSFCYGEGVSEILPEYVNVNGTILYSNDEMVSINTLLDLVTCFCKKEKETTKITSKYYTLCFLMSSRYYENFSQLDTMIIISILRSQLDFLNICFSPDPIFNGYDVIFMIGLKRIGSFNINTSHPIYIPSSGGGSKVDNSRLSQIHTWIRWWIRTFNIDKSQHRQIHP